MRRVSCHISGLRRVSAGSPAGAGPRYKARCGSSFPGWLVMPSFEYGCKVCARTRVGRSLSKMHDFLIGLAFIGMVICPAVVATFSRRGMEEEDL